MINIRRLVSNTSVSVVQTIVSGLVLFILYRYLIEHLGAEQLGLWSVVLASTSVARLSDMGLTGSVVKFVARYRALNDDVNASEVVQTATLSIAVVMAILCIAVYPLLDKALAFAIPDASMSQAISILPWAVFSLWLSSVGGVFQSGLDGCQRMDIRNIIMIVGNVSFLAAALWLVPNFGLVGLAVGQAVQGLMLMLASWLVLRRQLTSLPRLPISWSKEKFKEMIGYAVNFQISSIAILLFDPAIKLLMSRYGGLSSAAYYEMASQLIIKSRALLISATQALAPAVAELYETAPEKVRDVYLKAYRIVFFLTIPFFAAIFISLPLASELWLGYVENKFTIFGAILALGWGLNTLIGPAYFTNLGTGGLKWNTIGHVSMAFVNVSLGLLLGPILGGLGVAIGAMIALSLASAIVIIALHNQYRIPRSSLFPREHMMLLSAVVFFIVVSLWMNTTSFLTSHPILIGSIGLSIYFVVIIFIIWMHPYRQLLFVQLSDMRKSK